MKETFYSIMLLVGVFVLSNCASQKEITYLQGATDGYEQRGLDTYEIRIRPDDYISISVNSKDPELAQMFNLSAQSFLMGGSSNANSNYRLLGYLVAKDGTIDFPQLGSIKISGMTRDELITYIKESLISKGLVKDPVVTVQYLNFKVSVMGEVARPGIIEVVSDRITIFDALSAAGDLTIYGQRDNVKIIREENGIKTVYVVDLRSIEILDSPFYYLQQNDVVYVEPNKARAGQREINANRSVGTFASIFSVLLSATSLVLTIIQ